MRLSQYPGTDRELLAEPSGPTMGQADEDALSRIDPEQENQWRPRTG
ncbi:hypothetical protein ACFXB3_00270 [Streptomyces sp. NPDC059447]